MKIKEIKLHNFTIPLKEPKTWGWGTRRYSSTILVEIIDDEGSIGYGEIDYSNNQYFLENNIIPELIGASVYDLEKLYRKYLKLGYRLGSLEWSGIQTALYDLIGKKLNIPIYNLIGGLYREKVKIAPTISIDEIDKNVIEIKDLKNKGFAAFNLKAGRNINHDIELVKTIREEVGYEIDISLNFNMLLSLPTAITFLRKAEKYDIEFIFTPLEKGAMNGYRRLKAISSVPISIHDELTTNEEVARYCFNEAMDIGSVYVGVTAGIYESKKVCATCEAYALPVIPLAGELGINQVVCLHLACSTPNVIYPIHSEYLDFSDDILIGGKIKFDNGFLSPTGKPGIGVEIDWDKLALYKELYIKVKKNNSFDEKESEFITYSMR